MRTRTFNRSSRCKAVTTNTITSLLTFPVNATAALSKAHSLVSRLGLLCKGSTLLFCEISKVLSTVGYRAIALASTDGIDTSSPVLTKAVYIPADDLTDPAPVTIYSHLDAVTVLSRDCCVDS